jgi:tetratricopeptide (TPR) repeat protein
MKVFWQRLGRDVQMADMVRLTGLVLVLTALAGGCGKSSQREVLDVSVTGADQRKADLLNEIEAKYGNPDAHYELGKLYHADGLLSKAEWEYNVALGFDPVHRKAQAALVKLLAESGNDDRSKLSAEIFMNQAGSTAQASLLLGQAFQKEFLDDYAVACYQQALALAPNSAAINRQIGYYYLSKQDRVRAEEYLKRSFQLDPYQAEVAGELGRLGVIVQVPREIEKDTKKLDQILGQ